MNPLESPVSLGDAASLAPGETRKFDFKRDGVGYEGFVARLSNGSLRAYQNTCRHIPVSLDYNDNRFFTADGDQIMCQTHGALYDPETGQCVAGPCTGASLIALEIREEEGVLWLTGI